MRKLAEALGFKAMSLYTTWPNRDAIIDGLVEIVVSEIALPEDRRRLEAAMAATGAIAHRALATPPLAALAILSRLKPGPGHAPLHRCTLRMPWWRRFLPEAGRSRLNAVDSTIYGFHLQEIISDRAQDYAAMALLFSAPASRRSFPPLERLSRQVDRCRYDGFHASSFELEFIPWDGLERSLGPAAPRNASG